MAETKNKSKLLVDKDFDEVMKRVIRVSPERKAIHPKSKSVKRNR